MAKRIPDAAAIELHHAPASIGCARICITRSLAINCVKELLTPTATAVIIPTIATITALLEGTLPPIIVGTLLEPSLAADGEAGITASGLAPSRESYTTSGKKGTLCNGTVQAITSSRKEGDVHILITAIALSRMEEKESRALSPRELKSGILLVSQIIGVKSRGSEAAKISEGDYSGEAVKVVDKSKIGASRRSSNAK